MENVKKRSLFFWVVAFLPAAILFIAAVYFPPHHTADEDVTDEPWSDSLFNEQQQRNLLGKLRSASFPVQRFGPAPLPGDESEYMDMDVAVLDVANPWNESEVESYYLHYGGRFEMLGGGGNTPFSGITFDEIHAALEAGLWAKVEGYPFDVLRENNTYSLLHVERISILQREQLPLIIYHSYLERGKYTSGLIGHLPGVTMPSNFSVGRRPLGEIWKDYEHYIDVILNGGEKIKIEFNATEPIHFGIYSSDNTTLDNQSTSWGIPFVEKESVKIVSEEFTAPRRESYIFRFHADPSVLAEVVLHLGRLYRDPEPLLFDVECSQSSDLGVFSSYSSFPIPLPDKFTVGRTWGSQGDWIDHAYRYWTVFNVDEIIRFGFNASKPINFRFIKQGSPILTYELESAKSYDTCYRVESTEEYRFEFDIEPPDSSVVTFWCEMIERSNASRLTTVTD